MENLWTPWRMDYILGKQGREPGCIFDRKPELTHDKEELILYRGQNAVILLNRFPYANGHLLIAPARHVGELHDLTPVEAASLMEHIRHSVEILKKHLRPDGFNIGLNIGSVAGAGLADHLHFHVIPRWHGDHNFMTVIGEIRTIPQHIDETFAMLLPDFLKLLQDINHE
ncbi:MAG: HIT domain-containing protein [Proteobacteria bacterium]|nr:HIT domain-containing protein [Pseudomonadota bacterium]MBU0967151.1 HIT domain-containing protein [Pseudomonadota bacterium]